MDAALIAFVVSTWIGIIYASMHVAIEKGYHSAWILIAAIFFPLVTMLAVIGLPDRKGKDGEAP